MKSFHFRLQATSFLVLCSFLLNSCFFDARFRTIAEEANRDALFAMRGLEQVLDDDGRGPSASLEQRFGKVNDTAMRLRNLASSTQSAKVRASIQVRLATLYMVAGRSGPAKKEWAKVGSDDLKLLGSRERIIAEASDPLIFWYDPAQAPPSLSGSKVGPAFEKTLGDSPADRSVTRIGKLKRALEKTRQVKNPDLEIYFTIIMNDVVYWLYQTGERWHLKDYWRSHLDSIQNLSEPTFKYLTSEPEDSVRRKHLKRIQKQHAKMMRTFSS